MASRRKSRERALQVLFLIDQRKQPVEEAIHSFGYTLHSDDEDFSTMMRDKFMEHLVSGTTAQKEELDQMIVKSSENWRLDRMPMVDRNILRLAAFELREGKLPHAVIIDEALELARKFSGNESVGFVNGVLDAIKATVKDIAREKSKQPETALAAGTAFPDSEAG